MPIPRGRGQSSPGLPRSGRRVEAANPWRLAFVPAAEDPSAGAYGLLDPSLAEEPELPRNGLLSQAEIQWPATLDSGELPIPERKPPAPVAEALSTLPIPRRKPPLPRATVPFALRDRILEMPGYLAPAHQHEWGPFHQELRRAGMPSEMEIDLARTMFGYEGGMKPNKGNGAVGGITQRYLRRAREADSMLPESTDELSLYDVARLYRAYFGDAMDSVHVASPISRIPDKKAAGQMIDLLFMEGEEGGTLVQQAMNDLVKSLPDHVQHQLGVDEVEEDGDIGDVTYTRFNRLLNAGFGSRLRNDVADRALAYFTNKFGTLPQSIEDRMNQYR